MSDETKCDTETVSEKTRFIEELCLSGACNRGISYIGCFKKFEELGILKIKKILGVSIGAFIAVCHIIGYTSDDLLKIIIDKDMKDFKDFSFDEQGAILKGEKYRDWIFKILSEKVDPNITMLNFYKKYGVYFITTATCIYSSNEKFPEGIICMSHELTPDIPIITAVNSSMTVPFIFPPISYENARFVDGGILDNIPQGFMSKNAFNLKASFKRVDSVDSIKNPISYMGKIFELATKRIDQLKNGKMFDHVITISCEDFDLLDFDMTIDDKITLYKRGYRAIEEYMSSINF